MMGRRTADTRGRRAVRGVSAAAVSTLTAATAHTLSGGLAPLWLIVAAVALASPAAVWLVGRAPSPVRTAAVVATSQGLFHAFFAITAGTDPAAPARHLHPGSMHELAAGAIAHPHAPSATMVVAHVVAGALTALALVHGERMLSALGRGVGRLLRRAVGAPRPRPVRSVVVSSPMAGPVPRTVLSSLSRRGPPLTV